MKRFEIILILVTLLVVVSSMQAQQTCQPRMEQDPSLNNLVHPEGYETAEPGALGQVIRRGTGAQQMVLIAGAGFGAEIYEGFISANEERYTMIAVTLPGFGGSAAPPMPEEGTSYAEQTWTRGAQDAVARLIEDEGLDRPVVVGHWVSATQVVLGLALERPDLLRGAIVISGVPKFVPTGSGMPELTTPQQRAMMVDHSFAPQWFRTVTRETWDDNNYLPGDYAIHPLRGLQLWKQAAEPPLPVWVRYLCEYWAYDATSELERLAVPVLILQPEFDSLYSRGPQRGNYMETFLHTAWEGVPERSELLTLRKIADSRVFIMDDQPEALNAAVREFVDGPAALAPAVARPDPAPRATAPAVARRDLWNGRIERSIRLE